MKHTKYLRAGSLVCLLALCLGLLTACGGATLPLDKLYVDDARPGKPITLNTATEVFREKGTLEEVYGNLALFITRNEDSSLLKEIVCNLASGKKLYESEAYHERRMVHLLDGDLYSVQTPQDGGDSVLHCMMLRESNSSVPRAPLFWTEISCTQNPRCTASKTVR